MKERESFSITWNRIEKKDRESEKMSGIKRETIIRVILGICMIFVSIGMIYGKSKAGNADEKGRTYIEESEKTAKQKNTEKSRKDSTESTKAEIGRASCRERV